MSRPISRAEDRPSGFAAAIGAAQFDAAAVHPAGRRHHERQARRRARGSPTEQEMIAATGVSRTVVREAVAHLRAEGLVITRQGVGAFVAGKCPAAVPHRLRRKLVAARSAQRHGIAHRHRDRSRGARRRSRHAGADLQKVADCFEAIDASIERGEMAVDQDFAFHCAIADATGNPQFRDFWNISAASSFRGRRSGAARPGARTAPISTCSRKSTATIVQAIQRRRGHQGARGDARASAQQPPQRHQKLADELGVK